MKNMFKVKILSKHTSINKTLNNNHYFYQSYYHIYLKSFNFNFTYLCFLSLILTE